MDGAAGASSWAGPVAVNLPADISPFGRLVGLLGHYDFRVFVTEDAYVDVGAGSLMTIQRLDEMKGTGLLGTIGRFCEVNATARIHGGGEHDNDRPVNITFGGFSVFRAAFRHPGVKQPRPFRIGSGVVISAGAIVLAEAEIGDGAVIGAGAVVTRPVEPLGIYAGVPARKLRSRPSFAPWWDFDVAYLLESQDRLDDIALDPGAEHRYRTSRPRFALNMAGGAMDLRGFVQDGQVRPFTEAPRSVVDYVVQAVQSETPYWLADCWASESAA